MSPKDFLHRKQTYKVDPLVQHCGPVTQPQSCDSGGTDAIAVNICCHLGKAACSSRVMGKESQYKVAKPDFLERVGNLNFFLFFNYSVKLYSGIVDNDLFEMYNLF